MNPATSLSSAFMRRLARTPLRRRITFPAQQRTLSSSAVALKQGALPKPLDPYSSSALAALLARLSLPSTPALQQTLMACLTHPSFSAAEARDAESTSASAQENNELLAALGNSLLGLFASEEIAIRYPQLPSNALSAAVTSYVGPNALSSVARDLGLGVSNKPVDAIANAPEAIPIRWKRTLRHRASARETEEGEDGIVRRKDNFQEGLASAVRSFVGLIYQEQGIHAAREFVQAHFMSRHVDLSALFSFRKPKYVLSNVVSKHLADAGVPITPQSSRIESRVLASSGAQTQAPLFNIGLFLSNGLKLAEGHGSSLLMAEHRAAHNALLSLFLVQETNKSVLPTSIHAERPAAAAVAPEEKSFVPNTAAAGRESLHSLGAGMRQAL